MRALVTGCAGFIGSRLTESLLEDGYDVTGVDCFNDNYGLPQKLRNLEQAQQWDAFAFVPVDLSRGDLGGLVTSADVVFHLAAEPGVRASWGTRFDTYLRNNVQATQHLLEALRASPATRLVYASSSSVYGQAASFPTAETALPMPHSPYGTTKLAAEHLVMLYRQNYGIRAAALRYFSVYGPRQRPDMAFCIFFRQLLAGEPITVFGDGGQTRDFTFVDDVVAATRSAATRDEAVGGVYNIGGGSRVSLRECIDSIAEITGRDISITQNETQLGDVRDTGADTSLAQRDLGYLPRTELREGLALQFEWARRNAAALGQGTLAAVFGEQS